MHRRITKNRQAALGRQLREHGLGILAPLGKNVLTTFKLKMTAPELVEAIDILQKNSMNLTVELARGCPLCTHCQDDCYWREYAESVLFEGEPLYGDDLDAEDIGIEDLPIYLLDHFYNAGLCMAALDDMLLDEVVINLGE